jgi:hypothetical protein
VFVVPLEGVADGGDLVVLLCFVDRGEVEIPVDVQEGNFPLEGLFDLVEMDFHDGQVVLHHEVQGFAGGYLIELDDLGVAGLDHCDDVGGDGNLFAAHEFDCIT